MQKITDIKKLNIDKSWTLFLDRDGVINKRPMADYVKSVEEFEFLPGVEKAVKKFSEVFGRIFVITNQRGLAIKVMTENDLNQVHEHMINGIKNYGGRIDRIYYCPHDRNENCGCRKPDIGSALKAKKDFPEIDFAKSIMVGDTPPDMQFGRNAGMYTIIIGMDDGKNFSAASLAELADML